jgi:uncharacterized membrane protein
MLTSFGIFWGAEGAGAHWPGSDGALLVIIPVTLLVSLAMAEVLRRRLRGTTRSGGEAPSARDEAMVRV